MICSPHAVQQQCDILVKGILYHLFVSHSTIAVWSISGWGSARWCGSECCFADTPQNFKESQQGGVPLGWLLSNTTIRRRSSWLAAHNAVFEDLVKEFKRIASLPLGDGQKDDVAIAMAKTLP